MLFALAVAPLVAEGLDALSDQWWDGDLSLFGLSVLVPGVRLTLWLSAITIMAAGLLASWSLRVGSGVYVAGYLNHVARDAADAETESRAQAQAQAQADSGTDAEVDV